MLLNRIKSLIAIHAINYTFIHYILIITQYTNYIQITHYIISDFFHR